MTRYADTITLLEYEVETDSHGNAVQTVSSSREVFANRYTMGTTAWLAARSSGLHADCEYQLRSCDYAGEQRAIVNGVECEIESAQDTGEFTRLILKRRLPSG